MPFINSVRGVFSAAGPVGVTAPPLITLSGTTYNLLTQTITLSTAGEYQIDVFTKSQIRARVFGAGGGGAQNGGWASAQVGGSGGFASGILTLSAGSYKIIVGEGGSGNTFRCTFGGGASAQPKSGVTDNRYSACGGGFSGIFSGSGTVHDATGGSGNSTYRTSGLQARALIIAGGGGGGGNRSDAGTNNYFGGHGGGSSGTGGYGFGAPGSLDSSSAGTQSSAGAQRSNQWGQNTAGAFMQGGHGGDQGYGGGGGGGYFGGSTADSSAHMGGGGGGSGFLSAYVSNGTLIAGSGQTSPGGLGQTGYIAGSGYGGGTSGNTNNSWSGGAGGNGIVILAPL